MYYGSKANAVLGLTSPLRVGKQASYLVCQLDLSSEASFLPRLPRPLGGRDYRANRRHLCSRLSRLQLPPMHTMLAYLVKRFAWLANEASI